VILLPLIKKEALLVNPIVINCLTEESKSSTLISGGVISNGSVVVLLDYPLEVTDSSGKPTDMKKSRVEIPIRLKKMYELAQRIFEYENSELFLEKITIDLMALNSEVVPVTDSLLQCSPFMKKLSTVRTNIKNLVNYNFPDIRIDNTLQSPFVLPEERYADLHFRQEIDFEGEDYSGFGVDFSYEPGWLMTMQVSPTQGEFIRAEPMKIIDLDLGPLGDYSIPTCIINYHFNYDLEFPVLIRIIDQETTDHEASIFQFVMPVLINHNVGDKENYPARIIPDQVTRGTDEEFCANYPSNEVEIRAFDKISFRDLDDVNISFECAGFRCDVGEIQPFRGRKVLNAQLPNCNYGTITATYNPSFGLDYFEVEMEGVDTNTQTEITIQMLPRKVMNFSIQKYDIDGLTPYLMSSDESVIIDLINDEFNYAKTFVVTKDIKQQIELIKGSYEYSVEAILIKNDSLIGGYSGNWTSDERGLENSDELIFSIFGNDSVRGDEEAQFDLLINMEKYSEKIPEPRFK